MKNKLFTLPNILTLANLFCGCMAVEYAFEGDPNAAFLLIAAAALFDFSDGLAARLTGRYSGIGKELDSLADVVSFGVAPSAVLFSLFRDGNYLWDQSAYEWLAAHSVFSVALFSALRLARFNVDETRREEFTGLPTPAAALAISALGKIMWDVDLRLAASPIPNEALVAIAAAVSYLLISPLRMFSLKFSTWGWRENKLRYTFLASSAVLTAVFGIGGIALAVALYIVMSAVRHGIRVRQTGKND